MFVSIPRLPSRLPAAAATRTMAAAASSNSGDPPEAKPSKTLRVVIKGRVQGVFFRDWTVENARALGLSGWVRNRRDGSVEAVFSGDPAAVGEMADRRCRVGPPAAAVTAVNAVPASAADAADIGKGFHRKPTV